LAAAFVPPNGQSPGTVQSDDVRVAVGVVVKKGEARNRGVQEKLDRSAFGCQGNGDCPRARVDDRGRVDTAIGVEVRRLRASRDEGGRRQVAAGSGRPRRQSKGYDCQEPDDATAGPGRMHRMSECRFSRNPPTGDARMPVEGFGQKGSTIGLRITPGKTFLSIGLLRQGVPRLTAHPNTSRPGGQQRGWASVAGAFDRQLQASLLPIAASRRSSLPDLKRQLP
jgi:hypothetical protein